MDLVHDAGRTALVLEDMDGEPLDRVSKFLKTLERVKGIEPSSSAWKAFDNASKIIGCLDFSEAKKRPFRPKFILIGVSNDPLVCRRVQRALSGAAR